MKWSKKGFTLIEVVIAMSVLAGLIGVFSVGQRQYVERSKRINSTVEWYLMLRELERPSHRFSAVKLSAAGNLHLYENKKQFDLLVIGRNLTLHHPTGATIRLMGNVRKYEMTPNLVLTIYTRDNQVFKAHLLLPKRGPS